MRAYGTDRVRAGDGAAMIISSRRDKGWKARVPKTLRLPVPGTAVLWADSYYEVVIAATRAEVLCYVLIRGGRNDPPSGRL